MISDIEEVLLIFKDYWGSVFKILHNSFSSNKIYFNSLFNYILYLSKYDTLLSTPLKVAFSSRKS